MKKVNINNKDKVNSLIAEVESKAKQRLMQPYEHILIDIEKAENKLKSLGIAKKYWIGCSLHIQPESVPNSYKYKAEGTHMRIQYFTSGWFAISCFRGNSKKEPYGGFPPAELWLSTIARQALPNIFKL